MDGKGCQSYYQLPFGQHGKYVDCVGCRSSNTCITLGAAEVDRDAGGRIKEGNGMISPVKEQLSYEEVINRDN